MPITGTVAVSGIIAPTSVLDTYPVTDPQWGLGGLRSVGTTTDRNNIEYPRRQEGMMVYVQNQDSYYALVGGTGNTDWILFTPSGMGTPGATGIDGARGATGVTGANGTQILLVDSFSTSIDDILMKANTTYPLSGKTINVSYAGGVVPATGGIYLANPSQGTGFPVGFPTSAMNTLTFSSQTLTAGVGETINLRLVVTGSSSGDAYDFSVGMGNTIRWGGSTHASLTGSQLGTALANELLVVNKSSGLPHSIDINIGYNQYIFYALPTRLGAVKQSINNAAYGGSYLQGDLDLPGDASVTHANTAGFSESFYVYRSRNPNLGMVEVRTVAST